MQQGFKQSPSPVHPAVPAGDDSSALCLYTRCSSAELCSCRAGVCSTWALSCSIWRWAAPFKIFANLVRVWLQHDTDFRLIIPCLRKPCLHEHTGFSPAIYWARYQHAALWQQCHTKAPATLLKQKRIHFFFPVNDKNLPRRSQEKKLQPAYINFNSDLFSIFE